HVEVTPLPGVRGRRGVLRARPDRRSEPEKPADRLDRRREGLCRSVRRADRRRDDLPDQGAAGAARGESIDSSSPTVTATTAPIRLYQRYVIHGSSTATVITTIMPAIMP